LLQSFFGEAGTGENGARGGVPVEKCGQRAAEREVAWVQFAKGCCSGSSGHSAAAATAEDEAASERHQAAGSGAIILYTYKNRFSNAPNTHTPPLKTRNRFQMAIHAF